MLSNMFENIKKLVINGIVFCILFVLIVVGSLFLAREFFMWQGVREFRSSLVALKRMTGGSCADKLQLAEGFATTTFKQVRFTDSTKYNLEIVCVGFVDMPIVSESYSLATFISKKPGVSGLILDPQKPTSEYITLVVFDDVVRKIPPQLQPWLSWISKEQAIGFENEAIVTKAPLEIVANKHLGPATSCEGYGYHCCDAFSQAGTGSSIENLNSCPSGCFEQCVSRPLLLSVQTDPLMEWEKREVIVKSGAPVVFHYIADDSASAGPWSATISYGDGTSASEEGLEGSFTHTYTCASGSCRFQVSVAVANSLGVTSTLSPTSQLEVVVR